MLQISKSEVIKSLTSQPSGWLAFGGVIFVLSHFIYSTIGKGATFRQSSHSTSLSMQHKSDHVLNFQTMSNNRFWLQLRSLPSRWKHSANPSKKYPLLYFSFKMLFISSKTILPAERGARATSQLQLQRPPQWPCSWVGCPWGSHLHNRRHCISIFVITSIIVIILVSITWWSITFNIIKNHTVFKHRLRPQHQQFKYSNTQIHKYSNTEMFKNLLHLLRSNNSSGRISPAAPSNLPQAVGSDQVRLKTKSDQTLLS